MNDQPTSSNGNPAEEPQTGPTPPEDALAQAETLPTAASVPPAISVGAALAGVFMSPRETFARLADQPWWLALVPLAILLVVSTAASAVFMSKIDMAQLVRDQIKQSRFASQMSEAQIEEAAEKAAQRPKWVQPVIGMITMGLLALVLAGIFWLVLLAFGHDITFGRSFQVTCWAFLPSIITGIIFFVVIFIKDANSLDINNPLATNVAAFLNRESTPKPLYALLQALDVFKIWIIGLLGIGLGAAARCRAKTAIITVVALYAVWVLIRMGLALIF